jgi:hypothetical protein
MKAPLARAGLAILASLALAASCTNPSGFIKSVQDEVKTALKMYLEVKGFSPSKNQAAVSPSSQILVDFDRAIDLATVTPSTIVIEPGVDWSAAFNDATKQLTLTPSLPSDVITYTVSITKGVKAKDGAEIQEPLAWTFTTKKGPVGAVSINGGAEYAKSPNVSLSITANGEVAFVFASLNEADFAGDHPWYSLSGATYGDPPALAAGDGEKTVYMQFANSAKSEVSRVMSDTIVLDTTAPVVEAGAAPLAWNAATADLMTAATVTELHPNGYAWSQASGQGTVTFGSASSLNTGISAISADGTYTLTLTATDAAGNSASDTVTLLRDTVLPTVEAGPDIALNLAALSKPTNASVTDSNGIASYAWSLVSGPGTATFSAANALSTNVSVSADGTYLLDLTATDSVGNSASDTVTLVQDTSLPGVSAGSNLVLKIGAPSATTNAVVPNADSYSWSQVSGPAGGGTIAFGTPAALNTTVSADADGPYTIRLSIVSAGVSNHSDAQVLRDTVAPTVSANSGGASLLFKDSLALSSSATDATSDIASYAWAQSSGSAGTLSFSNPNAAATTVTASADGVYGLTLTVTDGAGNSSSDTLSVSYDSTPPSAPAVTGTTPTNDATPAWSWTSGGGGDVPNKFRYQLDGTEGSWTETGAFGFTPAADLVEGAHTLYVQERDAAGNWSAGESVAISVDLSPPAAPAVSAATPTNDTTPAWTWTPGGGGDGNYRVQIDSSSGAWTYVTGTGYSAPAALAAGSHSLYVEERDAVGNWSAAGSFAVLIDLTPPSPPTVMGSSPTNDTTPTWSWNSYDGDGFFRYQLDSTSAGGWSAETTATSYTPASVLSVGNHTLYVQERDTAGNWSPTPGSFLINIDTALPNAPIVSATSPTNNTMPTWTWTGGGGGNGKFLYALDSTTRPAGAGSAVNSYTPSSALSQANHYLCVWESNAAGSWSGYGYAWILVDTTPPTAPVVTGTTPTNNAKPTWNWTAGGGGSGTFRYQVDSTSGAWTTTTALTFTPASALSVNATHTLYVQERDAANNWSASGSSAVLIDTTPPVAPVVTGSGNPVAGYIDRTTTNNTRPTWSWTPGGGGNGLYLWAMDTTVRPAGTGSAVTSYQPPSAISAATHYLCVWESDAAGNWSPYGYWYIVVDTTVPTAPILLPPTSPSTIRTPTWNWNSGGGGNGTFECYFSPAGGYFTTTAFSYNHATELADGSYTISVREYDAANNVSTWSSNTLVINAPPATPTVSVSASNTLDTTPTWTWVANGFGNGTFRFQLDSTSGAWLTTTGTSYTPGSLSDSTHTLYVEERDAGGEWSAYGSRTVRVTPVLPYSGQTGVATSAQFSWRDLGSSYTLQTNNGSSWVTVATGITTNYYKPTSNLPASTTITWRVTYLGKLGATSYIPSSSGASFTTGTR